MPFPSIHDVFLGFVARKMDKRSDGRWTDEDGKVCRRVVPNQETEPYGSSTLRFIRPYHTWRCGEDRAEADHMGTSPQCFRMTEYLSRLKTCLGLWVVLKRINRCYYLLTAYSQSQSKINEILRVHTSGRAEFILHGRHRQDLNIDCYSY
jgi:hypothetical protein